MAPHSEPLLRSSRPSSEHESERIEEEDALLTGEQKPQASSRRSTNYWRQVGLLSWAVLATVLVITLGTLYQHKQTPIPKPSHDGGSKASRPSGKRNLIFMVSDGMGPTSLSLTRSYSQVSQGLPFDHQLVLDEHLIGSSRTRSTSSLITDSAAGATAFACGKKTYNAGISVLPDHSACGTVLEAAKKAGYTTGLVVTTRITDATPACFASHVNKRDEEDLIAEQLIGHSHPLGRVVDLMLGGGRCHFLPNSTGGESCRDDDTDVVTKAKESGWDYRSSRSEFDSISSDLKLPLLGLFARTDIPYEIDRADQTGKYPSLSEMAKVALDGLAAATKDSDQGFFLMIEGSRIDHAGHGNDPAAQVHEVLEYDKTFSQVLDFLDKDDVEGVLVSTSDHETGGLAAARQLNAKYPEYAWYPEVLANASHSASFLAEKLHEHVEMHPQVKKDPMETYIRSQLLERGLGIYDTLAGEMDKIFQSLKFGKDQPKTHEVFADMVSRRAQVGWSTHGHTAVDVNIYASNPDAAKALIGNHENTEIGEFMRDYLDLDLDAVTADLKEKGEVMGEWTGPGLGDATKLGLNTYHGEFY